MDKSKKKKIIIIIVVIILVIIDLILNNTLNPKITNPVETVIIPTTISPSSLPSSKSNNSIVGIGKKGYLITKDGGDIVVMRNENGLNQYMKSVVANDIDGMTEVFQNYGFFVSQNTQVLVIELKDNYSHVRIIGGDHSGVSVWVPVEFVSSL